VRPNIICTRSLERPKWLGIVWVRGLHEYGNHGEIESEHLGISVPMNERHTMYCSPKKRRVFMYQAPHELEIRYASVKQRLCALLIDAVVFYCLFILIVTVIYSGPGPLEIIIFFPLIFEELNTTGDIVFFMSILSSPVLYIIVCLAVMEMGFETTIGKKVLGLVVREEGRPDCKPTLRVVFLRECSKIITCLTLGIGFFSARFDPKKRALHDRLVKTVVLRK
jgi:uncharacterized RDD family membrane protein YckC